MVEQFLGRNMVRAANKAGLEVRLANSWNAYNWLTPKTTQRITKTMQNMRIEQKVDELLKMGLLMDNGGLMASASELLMGDNLEWVFRYFNRTIPT